MHLALRPAVVAFALGIAADAGIAAAAEIAVPAYVGSAACADCHAAENGDWSGSHHALAWTDPTEATVLGDFDDARFEHGGITTRFVRDGEGFAIEADDGEGGSRRFAVTGVAGAAPLQQYLLSPEPGRTQAFDVAWDAERGRWYHLYPDQVLAPGDGMHWTGPYKSWEARCAECHATGLARNYEPAARSYAPRSAEHGVGCEACHGPGEAHAAWARDGAAYDAGRWPGLTAAGLTVDLGASAEAEIQQCAGCHSRREAFTDGNPVPGTPYHDAYVLALLRAGLYHPDGSIEAEDYEYGSFLQSKMYARGVRCSDCHEPHRVALRAEGNAVCTRCHSPTGDPRFPTLRPALYDDPAHHFHEPGGAGAQCRNCHMIERVYMGIDGRRDHSFRVPRPDLAATGSPDACTDCHADRGPAWAAAEVARRFPDSDRRGPHFATTFAAARWEPAAQADALIELAGQAEVAGIVRATALDLLAPVADAALADRAAALLADPDPLVRGAAATLQRGLPPEARLERLAPALRDSLRAVRIAAARAMLDAPATGAGSPAGAALQGSMAEWRAAVLARVDFPETHMQIGGAALAMRDLRAAEGAFHEAVELDPQLVDGWAMLARIHAATGDLAGAGQALDAGLAANPDDPGLRAMKAEVDTARP